MQSGSTPSYFDHGTTDCPYTLLWSSPFGYVWYYFLILQCHSSASHLIIPTHISAAQPRLLLGCEASHKAQDTPGTWGRLDLRGGFAGFWHCSHEYLIHWTLGNFNKAFLFVPEKSSTISGFWEGLKNAFKWKDRWACILTFSTNSKIASWKKNISEAEWQLKCDSVFWN